ncbi:MAG: beta-mannosidase [Anaerolineae bacterium]
MYTQSLTGPWQFRRAGTDEWLPAQVPGGVHTDLLALGRIPDPFVADNEKRVQWVAESDWEYRRTFSADAALLAEEKVFLVCDGLDTLAEVRLNGHLLGQTDNMFRRYEWEVKPLLRAGENELAIAFASPVRYVTARQAGRPLRGVSQAIEGGPHLRKAPCQFGWDWGPQLPPIGIWKEIRLEGRSVARLADVHIRQRHDEGKVRVQVKAQVERWADVPLSVVVRVITPKGTTITRTADVDAQGVAVVSVPIRGPQLWWPNGYGEQPLYKVEVEAIAAERAVDAAAYQIGLRTIELRQQPDQWGKSWQFVVNGVPIFAKGANWIPADSFPTRLSDAHLEHLIRSAAAAHQNMLRVWGGGLYEDERFYDLCDRYGILVWQEFIFSCSIYPLDDPAFVENVRSEAIQNIRRLRHRACLALWCGNNEMEWGWESWGWARHGWEEALLPYLKKIPALQGLARQIEGRTLLPDWKALQDAYDAFFHRILPAWVAEEDPDHAYWPSSPSSNTPFQNVNGEEQGDSHYWEVWHGRKPFTAYRATYPRFQSEFGFQALPPLKTIAAYAEPADWNMTSYIMEHHQRNASGNGLMIGQMTDTFRMPKDFPSLVYLSMVLQAEGIRYGVEHWRRFPQRVAGTLYWQLNDCWPVASWSSLDYFGRWKALHYMARRFYAPVLLSILDDGPRMGIWVTNDTTEVFEGEAHWSLEMLSGEALASGDEAVHVAPGAAREIKTLDFGDAVVADKIPGMLGGNRRDMIFVCELWQKKRLIARNIATFVPNKHLALEAPGLAAEIGRKGNELTIEVSARSLARFVELELDGVDVVFSDNYFDVPAGRTVTVTCPLPDGWDLRRARAALRVRSLRDSYA